MRSLVVAALPLLERSFSLGMIGSARGGVLILGTALLGVVVLVVLAFPGVFAFVAGFAAVCAIGFGVGFVAEVFLAVVTGVGLPLLVWPLVLGLVGFTLLGADGGVGFDFGLDFAVGVGAVLRAADAVAGVALGLFLDELAGDAAFFGLAALAEPDVLFFFMKLALLR